MWAWPSCSYSVLLTMSGLENLMVGRMTSSMVVVMTGVIVRVWVVGTRPGDTSSSEHCQTDAAAGFNWYYSSYNTTNL